MFAPEPGRLVSLILKSILHGYINVIDIILACGIMTVLILYCRINFAMNNTLQNGFRLLEMLAEHGDEVSVKELAAQAGLPSSHVCRLLKTLLQTGHLEQSPKTRKYRVSLKLLCLAHARLMHLDLRQAGHPFAAQLAEDLHAHAYLSAPWQGRSIIVDAVWPRDSAAELGVVIGQLHSVFHSACGKVCAAFASPQDLERIRASLAPDATIEPLDVWQAEFSQIRENRFAVRQEQGILAVAAPLFRAGEFFCGAIGVQLPAGASLSPNIEQTVRRTARALCFALGCPFTD
jgi:DNA-binding IclR family transcriptional regulator